MADVMAELFDLEGKSVISLEVPVDAMLVVWAMRYFVRDIEATSSEFRETLPYVSRERWPADWRKTYVRRYMPNAPE